MGNGYKAKLDTSQWTVALDALNGPFKESLARRMLVEGGVYLRDLAKAAAVRSDPPYNPSSRGSQAAGTLADAIYLAHDTDASSEVQQVYSISWSNKKAWWGKLVEFPHWRTHQVHRDSQGNFYTDMSRPLPNPILMPARPFLRPTMDTYGNTAVRVMIVRGQKEFPILLAEIKQ